MENPKNKVLLLGRNSDSTKIVYNFLTKHYEVLVVQEQPESKKKFLRRRIKKLGYLTVIGQLFFMVIVIPILRSFSSKRKKEIFTQNNLDDKDIPNNKLVLVNSINDIQVIKVINDFLPQVVIVNGTRIISKKLLRSTDVEFVNTHAGITPLYRGVHGGYWALYNDDEKNCGVTVHFVNEGIDTGNIISQSTITVTKEDNFVTYPLLQLSAGLPLLKKAISNIINEKIMTMQAPNGKSKLYYHPTFFQYIKKYITQGIK